MAQRLIQQQVQKQQQVQRLSAQQMLQVKLLEMPLNELEESIYAELDDNPALESVKDDAADYDNSTEIQEENEDFETQNEREERADALDSALESLGGDDEMPDTSLLNRQQTASEYEETIYGDTVSFYDKLNEQMGERELTSKQRSILEYLIGSLDDDGLLRKEPDTLSDELAIYHNIDADTEEIKQMLTVLQDFDPPGIGAGNLQECLLLQIKRLKDERQGTRNVEQERVLDQMQTVISQHFEAFTKKHWDKIQAALHLSDLQTAQLQKEIRKLNPKPGAAMGETMGRNIQQITPDFIVDTADDGSITFALNQGSLPELYVSRSFADMVATYRDNKAALNRQQKEALLYAKEKVDKAQGYIEAVKQRRHTLFVTMRAIIDWQRKFFQDGDESDLRPMILKDIADKTGLDISTISRVSNIKYVQTKWGTFPLRFFFTDSYTTGNGEELSTRKMKVALKEIIDGEDKKHPMSDEVLTQKMNERGYPLARRTVAKYREQLGQPVARLRRE